MVKKICSGLYQIEVPLSGNPLKELNSYFIRGDERDLLIDTGFRTEECQTAIREGLEELGSDPARRDVLITHLHSDHSGNADIFAGPGGKIYLGEEELITMRENLLGGGRGRRDSRFLAEGFTPEMMERLMGTNPARIYALKKLSDSFTPLPAGQKLVVGDFALEAILVPGHTPGNNMFWDAAHGIMFTGDNILFDITPNITAWPSMEDALGSYLDSLERSKAYPVKLALPGHRESGDYHARIDSLLKHHKARLAEAYEVVKADPGANATQIAGQMTWKIRARSWEEFPLAQKYFAVGECMSHLDYLKVRGLVTREFDGQTWHYTAVR